MYTIAHDLTLCVQHNLTLCVQYRTLLSSLCAASLLTVCIIAHLASLLMVYTIAHNLTQVIRRPLLSSSCAISLFIVCNIVHYRVSKTHRMPYFHGSFSAKEPCNSWLFCCKMACNFRHPMGLHHPALFSVCAISLLIVCSIALCASLLILRNIALRLRHHTTFSQCV